jgi:serine acetyltransferase
MGDLSANRGAPRIQMMLVWLRFIQELRRSGHTKVALLLEIPYRVLFEWIMGIELRPKTVIGAGLTIFHGTGLVVNDNVVIGEGVTLRNGVVIGNTTAEGPCPVIGDAVEVGANAVILGAVRIGRGAKIGAGAVVTKDVPDGATVVGNPARVLLA